MVATEVAGVPEVHLQAEDLIFHDALAALLDASSKIAHVLHPFSGISAELSCAADLQLLPYRALNCNDDHRRLIDATRAASRGLLAELQFL